jgi:hypothetical protein
MHRLTIPLVVLGAALTGTPVLQAQKKPLTQPLLVASITGQPVALLPVTLVIADPTVADSALVKERVALVRFTDSLIVDGLLTRVPEIQWIAPDELRRMARRAGGLVPEPDKLGQAVMRTWSLSVVPDPLRSNLRKLVSIAGGGRYAFIPASVIFSADTAGVISSDLSVVLADTRTGRVVWRSLARGVGATPAAAITQAIDTIFPVDGGD